MPKRSGTSGYSFCTFILVAISTVFFIYLNQEQPDPPPEYFEQDPERNEDIHEQVYEQTNLNK